jgi:pyruvate dehydrogenase E1 component alpha subunit
VSQNAAAYGIASSRVDGMDVLAVREAVGKAVEQVRRGRRPYFLEALTYRFLGHSMADPSHGHYREKTEVDEAKKRDPLLLLKARMLAERQATEADVQAIEQEVAKVVAGSVEFAEASPVPALSSLEEDVYAREEGAS